MKILLIHNYYQSKQVGGEDIVFKNESKLLKEKMGKENVFLYEVYNDNLNKVKLIFTIWFSFYHYRRIKKLIQKHNIDLVHVHNFFPILTPSIFKAAKKSGAKVIHTLHNYRLWCISGLLYRNQYGICEDCTQRKFSLNGIRNKCYRNSLVQSSLAQIAFWFYKFNNFTKNIDYFFVLTNFQKEKVKELGIIEEKIILKPNSFPKPELSLTKIKNGYIYVGRLEESKGISVLLEMWLNLDKQYTLTLIGVGELDIVLKKKYQQSNIIFAGRRSHEETLKAISESNYLIQSSLWYETFGLTIIEAMSVGVPVIGFDIGTRKDFIQNGINGFLCNKDQLLDVVLKSYNYEGYDLLCKNAVKSVNKFQNYYITEQQINFYKKILEK